MSQLKLENMGRLDQNFAGRIDAMENGRMTQTFTVCLFLADSDRYEGESRDHKTILHD